MSDNKVEKVNTLGSVRLRDAHTNEIILVPSPSNDPNDPLNWSRSFRLYIALITCAAIFVSQAVGAGPSVAAVPTILTLFPEVQSPQSPQFLRALSKAGYWYTTTPFVLGMMALVYMPLLLKYGRRPVYLASFTLCAFMCLWCGLAKSWASELAARIMLGAAAGSAEVLAPLTIADTFFLHERGLIMSLYSSSLAAGAACGVVFSGLITIKETWRTLYFISTGITLGLVVLIFFTMPETAYTRNPIAAPEQSQFDQVGQETLDRKKQEGHIESTSQVMIPAKKSYVRSLRLYEGPFTTESILKLAWRPVPLLALPPVLWGTLCFSAIVGSFIGITASFATAYTLTYEWPTWKVGLVFVGFLIGGLLGIFGGGWLSDKVADVLTKKNGGIREPEMRLPAVCLSLVLTPIGLMLYAAGIEHRMHWFVPTLGLCIFAFCLSQSSNVILVYTVDAYRPVAGEVIVTLYAFKAAFGFICSFYINDWISEAGYVTTYAALSAVTVALFLVWIPLYFHGKRIRHASLKWSMFKHVRWDDDREVGE